MAGATKFWKKKVILAKAEATYGTDPTPTGVANSIVIFDVEWTPLDGDEVERNNEQAWFGSTGSMRATQFARLKFKVPYSGSGAAGTAPLWGPLHLGCATAQTLNAGVSAVYAPITNSLGSTALYINVDGSNQKLLGARANAKIVLPAKGRAYIEYDYMALWQAITDTAMPAPSYGAWVKDIPVNKANTVCTIFGVQCAMQNFELSFGNQVVKRDMTDIDTVDIVDRNASGTFTIQASTVAFKDWVSLAQQKTLGSFSVVHGTVAGNILTLAGASSMELGNPSFGESDGVHMVTIPYRLVPSSAGNDEFSHTAA